eukprot:TRINITY_DN6102_c0_g1_i4.p4 TRINITY_DN6102_c0_g1~~TRINITY_DN6102_c0_g1_i4.p4  ORF type:complete len:186 (+),score=20.91 TRINITY_DN6102_c0_g1_i4:69-560(+)
MGENEGEIQSQVFEVRKASILQRFNLKKPVFCIGGTAKVDLIGRTQIQEGIDDMFYNCVAVTRIIGEPVYNFRICYEQIGDQQRMVLRFWSKDRLLEYGGLEALRGNQDCNTLGNIPKQEQEYVIFVQEALHWFHGNSAADDTNDVQQNASHLMAGLKFEDDI